jgi:hypothetical protein
VLVQQRRGLGRGLALAAACEFSLEEALPREQSKLLEARDERLQDALVGEIAESRAPPEFERCLERRARLVSAIVLERAGSGLGEPLELDEVERLRADAIAGPVGLDRRPSERLAEVRDVALHEIQGGRGRVVRPDLVDDPRRGYDGIRANEKADEDGTLPCAAELDAPAVNARLERPEDRVIDRHLGSPARAAACARPHEPSIPRSARPADRRSHLRRRGSTSPSRGTRCRRTAWYP